MTSYKQKNELVREYIEQNCEHFHDYSNVGFNNLDTFKETLVNFLEVLEDGDIEIDEDGLCPGQVTDNLLGDPEDPKNFKMDQAKKIIMTYMPWEKYLKTYGTKIRNICDFYEDYFYKDILNIYESYSEKYGKNIDVMKGKFYINVPINKVVDIYRRNKSGDLEKAYGIKLGEDNKNLLLLPADALVQYGKSSDKYCFEIKKYMLYPTLEDKKLTNFCISSEDIKMLSEECDFYLNKLKDIKHKNEQWNEEELEND